MNISFTAAEIAEKLAGTVEGDENLQLSGFASAAAASHGFLTFAESELYLEKADKSQASAILLDGELKTNSGKTIIRVKNARIAFAHVMQLFFSRAPF